jgi:cytochrome c oxidase subunit 2
VLNGLCGKPVALAGGATVIANEDYLRESIVNPQAKIVQGFQPLMPTFQGLISEEGLMQLIAYVKSLSPPPEGAPAPAAPAPPPGAAPVPPAAGKTKEGR